MVVIEIIIKIFLYSIISSLYFESLTVEVACQINTITFGMFKLGVAIYCVYQHY